MNRIVVSITGNGLKTQEVVQNELPYPKVIDAKMTEFDALLAETEKHQGAKSAVEQKTTLTGAPA